METQDNRPLDFALLEEDATKEKPMIQSFDDYMSEQYEELPFLFKILYQVQSHILLTSIVVFVSGYFAGAYLGKFWLG